MISQSGNESSSPSVTFRLLRSPGHVMTTQLWLLIFVRFVSFCIKMSFVAADILLVN